MLPIRHEPLNRLFSIKFADKQTDRHTNRQTCRPTNNNKGRLKLGSVRANMNVNVHAVSARSLLLTAA